MTTLTEVRGKQKSRRELFDVTGLAPSIFAAMNDVDFLLSLLDENEMIGRITELEAQLKIEHASNNVREGGYHLQVGQLKRQIKWAAKELNIGAKLITKLEARIEAVKGLCIYTGTLTEHLSMAERQSFGKWVMAHELDKALEVSDE